MNRREFVVAGSFTLATLTLTNAAQEKKQYVCPPCGCRNDGDFHDATHLVAYLAVRVTFGVRLPEAQRVSARTLWDCADVPDLRCGEPVQ